MADRGGDGVVVEADHGGDGGEMEGCSRVPRSIPVVAERMPAVQEIAVGRESIVGQGYCIPASVAPGCRGPWAAVAGSCRAAGWAGRSAEPLAGSYSTVLKKEQTLVQTPSKPVDPGTDFLTLLAEEQLLSNQEKNARLKLNNTLSVWLTPSPAVVYSGNVVSASHDSIPA